ncbi:ATP-binding cassette domain-containing protein [Nocardiopsis composta]
MRAGPRPPAEGAPASVVAEDAGYRIDRRDLVGGVSFALEPGTLTAMVGPNGAGKSTMLGLLAGDLAPSAGSVRIAGRLPGQWRPRELALHRSVMLQQATSNFGFSVAESVGMGRLPHDADPGRDRAAVEAAVAESDLAALRDRDVTTLSGGEAARVAYARTSAQQAPVVLLDEPTAALDLKHQEGLLAAARSGATRAPASWWCCTTSTWPRATPTGCWSSPPAGWSPTAPPPTCSPRSGSRPCTASGCTSCGTPRPAPRSSSRRRRSLDRGPRSGPPAGRRPPGGDLGGVAPAVWPRRCGPGGARRRAAASGPSREGRIPGTRGRGPTS